MDGLQVVGVFVVAIGSIILLADWLIRKPARKHVRTVFDADTAYYPPQKQVQETLQAAPRVPEYQSTAVAVKIPLMRSIVSGGIAAAVAGFFSAIFGGGWEWAGGAFVLVTAGMWTSSQVDWTHAVHRIEDMIGADMDGDEYIGEPPRVLVDLNRYENGALVHTDRRGYSASPEQLRELATGILNRHQEFSEKAWAGSGRTFSQNELRTLRAEFAEDGLVEPTGKGRNAGYRFTDAGLAVLKEMLG